MNTLGLQAGNLRKRAERLRQLANGAVNQGFPARQDLSESAAEMCEAADTIDGLRKQVAKCQIAELKADYDTSRYFELFGTPERAARTLARMCFMSDGSCAGCPMFKYDIAHCKNDYSNLGSIVEWLENEVCDD